MPHCNDVLAKVFFLCSANEVLLWLPILLYQLLLLSWSVSLPCHAVAWPTFSPPSGRPLRGIKQEVTHSILGQIYSRLDAGEAHGGRGPAAAGSSSAGVISRLSLRYLAIFRRPRITLCSMSTTALLGLSRRHWPIELSSTDQKSSPVPSESSLHSVKRTRTNKLSSKL